MAAADVGGGGRERHRPAAGRLVAGRLGESVVDVPAKLAARIRTFDVGHGRKTDATDAHAIAMAALRTRGLRQLTHDEDLAVLRLLADRRDELSRTRAQTLNRLHRRRSQANASSAPTASAEPLSAAMKMVPLAFIFRKGGVEAVELQKCLEPGHPRERSDTWQSVDESRRARCKLGDARVDRRESGATFL